MAYVQLADTYFDHPKTLHLVQLLGPGAEIYPPRAWCFLAKFRTSGKFRTSAEIASACSFAGEPEALQRALVEAGFLDQDGLTVHNWLERTGGDLRAYERKKATQKLKRLSRIGGPERHAERVPERVPERGDVGSVPERVSAIGAERIGMSEAEGSDRKPEQAQAAPPAPPPLGDGSAAGARRKDSEVEAWLDRMTPDEARRVLNFYSSEDSKRLSPAHLERLKALAQQNGIPHEAKP